MEEKFFLMQIKHRYEEDVWDKGVVIKDSEDEIRQSFHAYLGAYAYGHEPNTDYVCCEITNAMCSRLDWKVWDKRRPYEPEPEPEPEEVSEGE